MTQKRDQRQSCHKKSADRGAFANCFLAKFALPSNTRLQKCLFSLNYYKKLYEKEGPHSKRQEMYSIQMEKRIWFVECCKLLRICHY